MDVNMDQNRGGYGISNFNLTPSKSSEFNKNIEMQETASLDMQEYMPNEIQRFMSSDMEQDNLRDVPQEPYIGMEFESADQALMFYNAYAQCVGFSTRIGGHYRSKLDRSIISRDYYCSREGFSRSSNQDRIKTRDGCKAMMTIKRRNGRWKVTKFVKDHNHPLGTPGNLYSRRTHKKISEIKKELLLSDLSASDMNADSIVSAIVQSSGAVPNGRPKDLNSRNYIGKHKLSNALEIDLCPLFDYFKKVQGRNSAFYHAIQVDEDYVISNVFWIDARSRFSYAHFCDVITFHTTCRKKGYHLPFVSIGGVNHHRQPLLFGCALISDESEFTYTWLFQTWLEAMNYQSPSLIITDHEPAIKAAVTRVFPAARHRFFKSNILEKLSDKLIHISKEHKEFQKELENIVNNSGTKDDFQEAWQSLLEKYKLKENQWLQYLYLDRHYWAPAYIKDSFFAGLLETKSLLDEFINKETTITELTEQYDKIMEDLHEKEMQADFDTLTNRSVLKTTLPMEEQASRCYTRKMFCLFQEELIQAFACDVKSMTGDGEIITYYVKEYSTGQEYIVSLSSSTEKGDCSCKMFAFEGIICRHVLAVYLKSNIFVLPSHYILKRWTKDAKKGILQDSYTIDCLSEGLHDMTLRYDILCEEALQCIEDGMCSTELFHVAMRELLETRKNILLGKQKIAMLRVPSNPSEETTVDQG